MAQAAPIIGTATTVTFATTGFSANLLSVDWSGITRGSVDTTHMGTTTARTFLETDLYDPGTLSVEMQFDSDLDPPYDTAQETVKVAFAGAATGDIWSATGFMTNFSITATNEELVTATAELKFTGAIDEATA